MSKWISYHYLINNLGFMEFEILEYLKKGLQPYLRISGEPLDCPKFCHMGYDLEDRIKTFSEMISNSSFDGIKEYLVASIKESENKLIEIKKDDPDYCSWKWLKDLSDVLDDDITDDNFKELYSYLDDAVFWSDNIEKFKIKHELKESVFPVDQDFDDFIKNLKVSYENDNEIKIRIPNRKANCFTCESLGFRDNTTNEWKTLIRILQDAPHTCCIGPASKTVDGVKEKIPFYDAQRKLLVEINKKLVIFLNRQYSVQIPSDFKLYELCQGEETGTYKFKFQVIRDELVIKGKLETKYEALSKDELLIHLYKIGTE